MNSIEFWKADILFYSRQQTAKSSLVLRNWLLLLPENG